MLLLMMPSKRTQLAPVYHKWTSIFSFIFNIIFWKAAPETRHQVADRRPSRTVSRCPASQIPAKFWNDPKHTSRVNPQDFKKQEVSLLFQKLHMQGSWDIWCLDHLGRMPVLHIEHNCSAAERTAKVMTAVKDRFCQALVYSLWFCLFLENKCHHW